MAEIMRIQGKIENIMDDDDFACLLREKLGDDAARYFLDSRRIIEIPDDPLEICKGECDRLYEMQGNHDEIVSEATEILEDIRVYKSQEIKVARLIKILGRSI